MTARHLAAVEELAPDIERQRQLSTEELMLLDTPREERFDRLTRLVRVVFDVPVSTITLLDRDRAWFKSCVGADMTGAEREETFCHVAVARGTTMVVEDARADLRFRHLKVVAGEPHLRFYAGFPIRDRSGLMIGTLCLFDTRPRRLDPHQLRIGEEIAALVEAEMLATQDTARARRVQRALLPRTPPAIPGYAAAATVRPAAKVSGDFFDHQVLGERHAFTVADVMGKGTGAALLTSGVRAATRSQLRALDAGRFGADAGLGAAITEVNAVMIDDLGASETFVTGFFGLADPASGEVQVVDAGHGLALLVRADGTVEHLHQGDLPLGIDADQEWHELRVVLAPGDELVVFSDGLLDLYGSTSAGLDDITALVLAADGPQDLVATVEQLTLGTILPDDVTVLAIRRDAGQDR